MVPKQSADWSFIDLLPIAYRAVSGCAHDAMDGLRPEMCSRWPPEHQRYVRIRDRVRDIVPPETQTCSVDEGGFVSKGPMLPFPVNRLTVPFN